MTKKNIILTGGGTAGHIMPNLALMPKLKEHFDKIYYLGAKNSMEEKLISKQKGIIFKPIPTTKFIRSLTLKNLIIPFKLLYSVYKTKKLIKGINPDVIFCKGGFVSVPVAIAGHKLKIPVISHESDLSLGLANKIILKYANVMCTSFETTAKLSKKCIFTGSPIRQQIYYGDKNRALLEFKDYDKTLPTVMFFGGSLGSKNINNLVVNSLDKLAEYYNIIHIVGKNNKTKIEKKHYFQLEFTDHIEDFFALADMVVCRGGANSLFELLALKKPMLIIPLSKTQSRGDQIENANYFKKRNYAEVLFEEDMSTKILLTKIQKVLNNATKTKIIMQSLNLNNPNVKIVDIILNNIKK